MKTRSSRGLYSPELLESRIAPATFVVTNLTDADPKSLRDAVTQANGTPGPDIITFDIPAAMIPGTIHLTSAEIAITEPVTIKGSGIDKLAVSGDDARRIFNIDYTTDSLVPTVITGLALTDGKATGVGGAIASREALTLKNVVISSSESSTIGGGVAVFTQGKISITSCRIFNNTAALTSGGLYLAASGGISVAKSTIANNTAKAAGGLYAHISAGPGAAGSIVLDKLVVTGNSATNGTGGGMSLEGQILLKKCLITGNSATDKGGALYLDEGHLSVKKTTFSNNTAATGGAVAVPDADSIEISGSRFIGNFATNAAGGGGAALYLFSTPVSIAKTVFSGNISATDGGAIATSTAGDPIVLDITRSNFSGNAALDDGGAICLHNKAALTLDRSVLSGNTAGPDAAISPDSSGGGIYADTGSSLNVTSSKFTENKAGSRYGGAIAADGSGVNAVAMILSGNFFQANFAATYGGAVSSVGDGSFRSTNDKVIANFAQGDGGGFYLNLQGGGIFITGSTFQGNVAGDDGGGMRINGESTLSNVKVLENVAATKGGGIFSEPGGFMIRISNSLVTGNVASTGGGIFSTNTNTTIPGSTVTGNSAQTGPNTSGI